ncbi:HAD-IA family hydrolase [Marinibaculum pumilum]|uniref:HAD-IA family hydrolase n=1 Tax=Marinibaculum pumilum TaxID=1766165 RepID=A0ABV7KZP9_9PROT
MARITAPSPLRLVIFDMDGTLVDSAGVIVAAMQAAFAETGRPAPAPSAVHGVIGLHLPEAMARLCAAIGCDVPEGAAAAALTGAYRHHFLRLDSDPEQGSMLFPGIPAVLERLEADGLLLAVATGKGRRGMERVLDGHGLLQRFVATRTPDESPGKPHPGMVLDLLALTGADAADTVVVGDSLFDMDMARNAGVAALGVSWGTAPPALLRDAGAIAVAGTPEEIPPLVDRILADRSLGPAVSGA